MLRGVAHPRRTSRFVPCDASPQAAMGIDIRPPRRAARVGAGRRLRLAPGAAGQEDALE